MNVQVYPQPTPNPMALKFIISEDVISEGKATFKKENALGSGPLVESLLDLPQVDQIHLFENVITVNLSNGDWSEVSPRVESIIKTRFSAHDKNSLVKKEDSQKVYDSEELKAIDQILDRTIRPALQGDGGDLEVLEYKDNNLYIRYEGACGTCPSATMGTLGAIEAILRDEFHPEITVIPEESEAY